MSAFALQPGLRVLVTGAAAGIGRGMAETFLTAGARVFVCDCDGDALARVAYGINASGDGDDGEMHRSRGLT
jgi:NAD(P)-dependent dehydrogenase (short-subunit alcohol dehydrogenase family)